MALDPNTPDNGGNAPNNAPAPPAANPPVAPLPDAGTPSPVSNMPANAPPVGAPQQTPSPAAPSRSFMGALAHALIGSTMSVATHGLKTLAGPQAPDSYTTDETGKMTPNYSRPDNSRDRIARIAMHALEGLAAGSQVPQQKSGAASALAGIGAGAASQINEQRQQDLLQRQQATAEFERQQKALVQKYQNAHWNAQTAVEIENAKKLGEEAMQSHYKNTQDLMAGAREGDLDVSEHSIAEAEAIMAADKAAGSSSFVKHVVLGMLPPQPQLENGKPVLDAQGNQIMEKRLAIITEDKNGNIVLSPNMVQRIQRVGKMAQITNFDGLKPGQPIPLENFKNLFSRVKAAENIVATKPPEIVQVDDGTGKKKWMKSNALGEKSDLSAEENLNWQNKLMDSQKKGIDIQHIAAQTRKEDADTAKTNEETKQLKEWDTGGPNGNGRIDVFGNPVGAPGMDRKEYLKRVDTYTKDYSKDLNQLDAARSQLNDIITNAEKTKKLPGADAVVGIFDAIGISSAPLKGRGFRINNSVVSEHVEGTRNAWQNMALKLSRLTPDGTGQIVSLDQLKDYERIMDAARRDAYVGAANDAVNRGIGIQSIPRGNGAAIDDNTMDIFLTLAKGDPKTASSIARQFGWAPPAASR